MSFDRGWDLLRQASDAELLAVLQHPDSGACAHFARAANINLYWAYGAAASEAFKRGIVTMVPAPRKEETS